MEDKKVSKRTLNTAERYLARMQRGERIIRDSNGRIQWDSGKSVGRVIIAYMLNNGIIKNLDSDLFGDKSRGQTIGVD